MPQVPGNKLRLAETGENLGGWPSDPQGVSVSAVGLSGTCNQHHKDQDTPGLNCTPANTAGQSVSSFSGPEDCPRYKVYAKSSFLLMNFTDNSRHFNWPMRDEDWKHLWSFSTVLKCNCLLNFPPGRCIIWILTPE